MVVDLCRYGFVPGYEVWIFHGEKSTQTIEEEERDYSGTGVDRIDEEHDYSGTGVDRIDEMLEIYS
jgi:hypothetical protein